MASCKTRLKSIKNCADNAGGNANGLVKVLKVAFKGHVDQVPGPAAGTSLIESDIVMKPDVREQAEIAAAPETPVPGVFYDIDLSEIGLTYTAEEEGEGEDGNIVHTITGLVPKMSPEKNYILDGMRGGAEHIVQWTDRNRTPWLMGDDYEGATCTVVPQTNDRNGYTLTIRWRTARLLYSYTGAIPQA